MYFRATTVSSRTPDLFARPTEEIKPIPHLSTWTIAYSTKLVGSSQGTPHMVLKERGVIATPCPPFPMQSKLQISSGGRVRSHHSTFVASCPDGQRPPRSYSHCQVKVAEEECELQPTLTVSAKSNADTELSFPSLYSPDSGTPDAENNQKKEVPYQVRDSTE
ncbi:hypothetical protein WISP_128429 [Willisornis vidua]|uniref:Uncharacterized protein n=1 Tax=Willisornis vidua TaxID=1566151 RepID=A0ABQ9CW20_9PASS|nr:hypothetical protein WISP_128429 [Willisornis vidua]